MINASHPAKVLLICYGGTAVMVIDAERRAVVPAGNVEQILSYLPPLPEDVEVEFELLANLDSANMASRDWVALANHITGRMSEFDAFVIVHGTNTMEYTSSALALALGRGLAKPVILTGSQLPLTVYGNDARFNLEHSIRTAAQAAKEGIAEVMVLFNDRVMRGARTAKISESAFSAFDSPNCPHLAALTSTGVIFRPHVFRRGDAPLEVRAAFDSRIITIDLTPGLPPALLRPLIDNPECRGLILRCFGAGAVASIGSYSLLDVISYAVKERKMPVLLTTKFLGGNAHKEINDEPAVLALKAGAISTADMTVAMAQVKLMWLLAQGYAGADALRPLLTTNFVGEVAG
jgi:L-asparaginase